VPSNDDISVRYARPRDWHTLCGRSLDWVEVVTE
jgi:hypothetical protein